MYIRSVTRAAVRKRLPCGHRKSEHGFATAQRAVFDRSLKQRQRLQSLNVEGSDYYDYLRNEAASRLVDRIEDINRSFPLALELGSYRGEVYRLINAQPALDGPGGIGGVVNLVECDSISAHPSDSAIARSAEEPTQLVQRHKVVCDEEFLPFEEGSFDIVLSNMTLHWVNDLPSTLRQIKTVLKPDGVFIGNLMGGKTLQELRHCFYLADMERKGGLSPHASPLALPSDIAALMQAAGFTLPTIDIDTITVSYPDAFTLMDHLWRMGEGSAALQRQYAVGRDTLLAMAAIYQDLYGMEDGSVSASFELISVIGWSPDASQPKPCRRGSAQVSMKTIPKTPTP